jgi:hypothetical protein
MVARALFFIRQNSGVCFMRCVLHLQIQTVLQCDSKPPLAELSFDEEINIFQESGVKGCLLCVATERVMSLEQKEFDRIWQGGGGVVSICSLWIGGTGHRSDARPSKQPVYGNKATIPNGKAIACNFDSKVWKILKRRTLLPLLVGIYR